MRACSRCPYVGPESNYPRTKNGYRTYCKSCLKESKALYHSLHLKEHAERSRRWVELNKSKRLASSKKWRVANKDYHRAYKKQWRKDNPELAKSYVSSRRAKFRNATPKWLTKKQKVEIRQFYVEAQKLKQITGKEHHVDHIIPLHGVNVSGLHVPWNLQILEASANMIKGNKCY